jgi:hypothetical protein
MKKSITPGVPPVLKKKKTILGRVPPAGHAWKFSYMLGRIISYDPLAAQRAVQRERKQINVGFSPGTLRIFKCPV